MGDQRGSSGLLTLADLDIYQEFCCVDGCLTRDHQVGRLSGGGRVLASKATSRGRTGWGVARGVLPWFGSARSARCGPGRSAADGYRLSSRLC